MQSSEDSSSEEEIPVPPVAPTIPRLQLKIQIPKPKVKIEETLEETPEHFNPECPICGNIVAGDINDVNEHVDFCLSRTRGSSDEEDDGAFVNSFEAFEIPEEPLTTAINIEGDESRYGKPQYSMDDINKIISSADPSSPAILLDLPKLSPSASKESLLERVSIQHDMLEKVPRCLICLDSFVAPVVSVGCWHVCCEVCWCKILGAKRLCPQCNRITSPDDLRKIYL